MAHRGPYRVPGLIQAAQYVPRESSLTIARNATIEDQPFPQEVDATTFAEAIAWANNPTSFCFQASSLRAHVSSLAIVTVSQNLEHNVTVAIHTNRLLLALEQNARYCHFISMDPTRAVHWTKILAVKQALALSPYVLWLDADAVIARFDVPVLQRLLSLSASKDVLFSSEFNQPRNATDASIDATQASVRINTGAVFFKSSEFTFQFLDSVYKEAPKWTYWLMEKDQSGFDYWQQAHSAEWLEHMRVVHYRYMNSFGEKYKEGDLVYHVAGGIHNLNKFDTVLERCRQFNCRSRLWKGQCTYHPSLAANGTIPKVDVASVITSTAVRVWKASGITQSQRVNP
ncbi:hypothetical protein DUNSADRAFT_11009 [Dunaliella salina]|uniref:Nucleotide-diphospho-sugar transferase n=1 Tax=Dunaliella salina TaxID=3046 RepID=A0ABQ7GED9_DUNSA|nr:hypothetical protein DUNSADRAFT_11009 [Dunaliella salina]|eukprot:KAF5832929.1 hypothetical protein DUNSADRAFT_11009 [Dunaliella salina]